MSIDYRICRGNFEIADERSFLAEIRKIAGSSSAYIIFFDRNSIAGCDHIRAAVSLAERSFFEYKTPISNSFEMEVLLYAFGTRQTGFASGFGIHKGMNESVIVICRKNDSISGEDREKKKESFDQVFRRVVSGISSLEGCTGKEIHLLGEEDCRNIAEERSGDKISRLAEIFSITPRELEVCGGERIEEIVIERCALLDVNR
ncbi:KEOPS complex subunit Cgi121 [Methanolacinia paynteri]|uniref:KEOPS complex subunit Cgi121 n=1 Tax=Methanolacinia paynteri TaxID=230356 RepID=UPI00064F6B79|nr:KEOPS complex subunit Cgi121 [Methanolacinia paynteri]